MEKRLWIAMILSFLLLFLYQSWIVKKRGIRKIRPVPQPSEVVKPEPVTPVESRIAEKTLEPVKSTGPGSSKDIVVENSLYTAVFTTQDAGLKSFKLKKYRDDINPESSPIELVTPTNNSFPLATSLNTEFNLPDHLIFNADRDFIRVYEDETLKFIWEAEEKFRIEKQFRFFKDSYRIEMDVRITNLQEAPLKEQFFIGWYDKPHEGKKRASFHVGTVVLMDNKTKRETLKNGERKEFRGRIEWFAYETHYFISAIIPKVKEGASAVTDLSSDLYTLKYQYEPLVIPTKGNAEYNFSLFIGPKDYSMLKVMNHGLEKAVDLGWFQSIASPLLIVLKWLYGVSGNYGVAIIILTLLVRIIFFPLSIISFRSMKKMQQIQPIMKDLQKKYAKDKEKLNKEMLELYRRYKVNPFSGCLPMVVQIPVFIALYQVLMNAIELRHAVFFLWINDLSSPEALFSMPIMGYILAFRLLPLLMGGTMYFQQKLTPQMGDPQQMKIMMWMPVFLTFMLYNLPSGLNLYWAVSNGLSIVQQLYINKKVKG